MKQIILATKNKGKLKEIQAISQNIFELKSLNDLSSEVTWDETGETFHENALIKAKAAKEHTDLGVLADDSGLVVEDLDGAPGVYSKRYASQNATNKENMLKLLEELNRVKSSFRKAYFITSLVYIDENKKEHSFEGKCHGSILREERGLGGFGYDPIFLPDGFDKSFGELGLEVKNKMSHRQQAFQAFLDYIKP